LNVVHLAAISSKEKKMTRLGPFEIIAILVVVLLLFGPGRIGKIAGEIGQGIRNFRDGLGAKKEDDPQEPLQPKE
jgi:sec-independent protein translocase protein TatA